MTLVQALRRLVGARRLAVLVVLALVVSGGCGSDERLGDGNGDRAENGLIRVDEAALSATVVANRIRVDIPIQSLGKATFGKLNVSLRQVDGKKTLETTSATYALGAGATAHVIAELGIPAGVVDQADWVRSNLRIDDGTRQGLRVTSSLLRIVSPYELKLEGPKSLPRGKTVTYRVHAQSPFTLAPIGNLPVALALRVDDKNQKQLEGTTDALGDVVFDLQISTAGDYSVVASTSAQGTSTELGGSVSVTEPGRKLLLTTDKPIYQPGQVIHLRSLTLAQPDGKPVTGEALTFEIEDGKGNKIFKRTIDTDDFGIAATEFTLGRILNMGTFKVRAVAGVGSSEKTVEVSRYALPKFKVGVSVDKTWYLPAQSVVGELDAGYFFGKPVAGADVLLEGVTLDVGETVFQQVVGKTDAEGRMAFSLTLPPSLVGLPLEQGNALVSLRATVTDTAGQAVKKETALTVAEAPLRVVLIPEATAVVPGVENHLSLFAADPLGAPVANAIAQVFAGGKSWSATTDAWGFADLTFTPTTSDGASFEVNVTPEGGSTVKTAFSFAAQPGSEHVLVRTDKSVYGIGETVKVEILASAGELHAYVDWLNQGQAVDMRTLELDASGRGAFTMPVDTSLLGTNRVEAYIVDADGNVVRAGRTVFARTESSLAVALSTDKPVFAPGEPAKLTFTVTDETGKPVVAALGVQIVDEAVYALIDAKPGLLKTYFGLEDAYAEPKYEIQPPPGSLPNLLFEETSAKDPEQAQAAQVKTAATLAALGTAPIVGLALASYQEVLAKVEKLLEPYYASEKQRLADALRPTVESILATLAAEQCTPSYYWCDALGTTFSEAFDQALANRVAAWDFWGNPYRHEANPYGWSVRLTTSGPDEKAGTRDDATLDILYSDISDDFGPPGAGGNGAGGVGGGSATGGMAGGGGAGATEPGGPRVRQDFPETLYVNPKLITGADGKASVSLSMADSITEWRVSTLAHSTEGKLGGGVSGIKVFQDFFADVNFPATLTRGDEIDFPIAVYNYLTTAESVKLELTPGSWYTALGATTQTVNVGPGEVVGVRFPVRVETVGLGTLTVTATGSKASDAVARKVLVVPDGKAFPTAASGSLAAGTVSHSVSFPSNAVPGSPELWVELYPAFLSQVVTGMDSMLQVPFGCFEQTTSTTWPNVLVTRYMTQTGQITPEIQLKAESLISAGYQRLLTFEHSGGGFSWFGEQDPEPFLSVTAFGLMEFADMAKVSAVDPAMMARTQAWLLGQQKTDGSWEGDQTEFFSFQTSVLRNTAFVIWALAANGYTGPELAKALAFAKGKLGTNEDGYTLGLVANAFAAAAPNDPTTTSLLDTLESKKKVDGKKISWDSAGTQTNFYAAGDDAAVTATALVAHAMLLAGGHKASVDGALEFLVGSKDTLGNFGSTQATIWTLRTLILAAEKGTEGAVGSVSVSVDGQPFTTVALTADKPDVMTTVDLATLATTGPHQVELAFVGTGKVSYNVISSHHLPWANVPPEPSGPLSVSVGYDKTTLALNDFVKAAVTVVNNTSSIQNMVILTVGIPPGFAVQTQDLDPYVTSGSLSSYELTGKQLTLYLGELLGSATAVFEYRLLATMPVKASDGGASAYLYYQPEKKSTAAATTLDVGGS